MFTAILTACLVSAPLECRCHEMVIASPMPVIAFLEAQAMAAAWMALHPELTQQSLTIRPGRST